MKTAICGFSRMLGSAYLQIKLYVNWESRCFVVWPIVVCMLLFAA